MSMFSRPTSGGSGGGLTSEQYSALTQDAELLQAVDNINAHTTYQVSGVASGIQSILYSGSYLPSGSLVLANRPNGQPSPGFRRVSGFGVPSDFFAQARTVMLPYTVGANGVTSNGVATGRQALLGETGYFIASTSARKFSLGTMAWTDLPNVPTIAGSSLPPTTFGTAGGFVFATGFAQSTITSAATLLLDPATDSWSQVANQPTAINEQGIADLGDGRCALFGGKTTAPNTALSATTIVDTVRIYDAASNSYTAAASLPIRMCIVRTSRLASGAVLLYPSNVFDGTTLVNGGNRRLWLWTETNGTVELDSLPSELSLAAYLMHALPDGRLVYVPAAAPASGSRARVLNPAAPSGSQWSNFDWDMNANATYQGQPSGCETRITPSGFAFTAQTVATSIAGVTATYMHAPAVSWSESFYQQRIE